MEMTELARLANEYTPKLRTHDRQGRRADVVEFHPAYHRFMEESIKAWVHASVWEEDGTLVPGEHVAALHAALSRQRSRAGASLPDHDDPCRYRRARRGAEAASGMAAAHPLARIRSALPATGRKAWRYLRHGHDRETGRHGCAPEHHAGDLRRGSLSHRRPQMVFLRADVRRFPRTRAGERWADLVSSSRVTSRTARPTRSA